MQDSVSVSGSESGRMKLQLPASCDPPQPGAPVKQLVWIVSNRNPRFPTLAKYT
jgi:hypothetical protein